MEGIENKGTLLPNQTKQKYNSVWLGLSSGIVLPFISFVAYYLIMHRHMLIISYFNYLKLGGIFTNVASLCVVPNLGLFYIFLWLKKDKSARGVVTSVIIYALILAAMKLF